MAALGYIAAGFALCLALVLAKDHFWSFRAQSLSDYAGEAPEFDVRTSLGGVFLADGVIYDYSGRVNARFRANITGSSMKLAACWMRNSSTRTRQSRNVANGG